MKICQSVYSVLRGNTCLCFCSKQKQSHLTLQPTNSKWLIFALLFTVMLLSFMKICIYMQEAGIWQRYTIYCLLCTVLYMGHVMVQVVSQWLLTTGGPSSMLGYSLWDLWWTKWQWGSFSLHTWVFPCVWIHQHSIIIHLSLTASLNSIKILLFVCCVLQTPDVSGPLYFWLN
jgi:hypothetical protein